jgi:hypothetical protein
MVRAIAAVATLAVAALATGCKSKSPKPPPIVEVEGVIRLDGVPLSKAAVRFVPVVNYGQEYFAVGVTDETGHYHLTCKGKDGACACESQVVVSEGPIPPEIRNSREGLSNYLQSLKGRPLPKKYASLAESPLTADVNAGQKQYDFDLESDR